MEVEHIRHATSPNCVFCNRKITNTEFQYEDYYEIHRGMTEKAEFAFICFDCLQNNRKKND
jgi:hypothetical protein